jgi:two-component system sensor histidine kinase PhoQ
VTLAAALVLVVFIALTSLALERAFQASARSAREERLLGQLYLLMAAAEAPTDSTPDSPGETLTVPPDLAESRFGLPGSGLYGQVTDAAGDLVWRSPSALGPDIPFDDRLRPGERRFREATDTAGNRYFVEGYGVVWSIGPVPHAYTFSVAEDLSEYQIELARFRTSLAGWLAAMALLLLAALLLALRWGLTPLRRVADEVAVIEAGAQDRLSGTYPRELRPLTDNLNALLANASARQTRLANALADLAHSLKTPLTVMRGALGDIPSASQVADQINRMDEIVAYHLERARARPVTTLTPPVPVAQAVERLLASLTKLHGERAVDVMVELAPGLSFRGVEGDLLEVLGNLLDNAFKWCRSRVTLAGRREGGTLVLWVEDDGPGIPTAQARRVLERGARADLDTPGHGIGLAVVREICLAYGGELAITESPLGGARVQMRIPA